MIESREEQTKNAPKRSRKTTVKHNKEKQPGPLHRVEYRFPKEFPFWARLKIGKNRTTLVIDEDLAYNKKTKKYEDGFVNREATHQYRKDYKPVIPNPDSEDTEPMFLKRPTKKPKKLFKPHNKKLNMPTELKEMYAKNNKK